MTMKWKIAPSTRFALLAVMIISLNGRFDSMLADYASANGSKEDLSQPQAPLIPFRILFVEPDKGIEEGELKNRNNTVKMYQEAFQKEHPNLNISELLQVTVLNDTMCKKLLNETDPRLLDCFEKERYGAHKSDICRAASLYRDGGYYFDNDVGVIIPFLAPPGVEFASVRGGRFKDSFTQAFMIATPGNPVLKKNLELTLDHYDGKHIRNDKSMAYHVNFGTKVLFDGFTETLREDPSYLNKTFQLQEVDLTDHPDLEESVKGYRSFKNKWCRYAFELNRTVHFLARAAGASVC